PVEVRPQVRQRLLVEIRRDRDVLLGGGELVADLLLDRIVELAHRRNSTAGSRTLPSCRSARCWRSPCRSRRSGHWRATPPGNRSSGRGTRKGFFPAYPLF